MNSKIWKILLTGSLLLNLLMGAYVCKRIYFILSGKDFKFTKEACDEHCKYFKKVLYYEMDKNEKNEIVFLGNSLTEYNDWSAMFGNPKIKNRGIGGDNTVGVLKRLNEVLESQPEKIFLEIGINDVLGWSHGYPLPENYTNEKILENYEKIIVRIKTECPETKLFIQNILPVVEEDLDMGEDYNSRIKSLNQSLKELCEKHQLTYIDLYQAFQENDSLKAEFTYDGIHLTKSAYLVWEKQIEKYVRD